MGINLLPALGAVGATALGLPAFLGAGLGSAASGSDPENIIKDAALGGIGSFAMGGAGTGGGQFANLFTSGGAKKGGGILNYIMNKPGNALQFAGLASSMAGVAQDRNKDPFAVRTQMDDLRMSEYIENISDMKTRVYLWTLYQGSSLLRSLLGTGLLSAKSKCRTLHTWRLAV